MPIITSHEQVLFIRLRRGMYILEHKETALVCLVRHTQGSASMMLMLSENTLILIHCKGVVFTQLSHLRVSSVTSLSPALLAEGDQLASHFSQLCGNLNPNGWTVR